MSEQVKTNNSTVDIKLLFFRFLSFWRVFLISLIISISVSFFFLRYAEYNYSSSAKIEIIDKAQDSEMSLPTAMTVFNRSMINLENEIGRLSSYTLNSEVASLLKLNVKYYTQGRIKKSENHASDFFEDYELTFNIDTDTITNKFSYVIEFEKGKMIMANSERILKVSHFAIWCACAIIFFAHMLRVWVENLHL